MNNQTKTCLLADIGLTRQSWCVLLAAGAQGKRLLALSMPMTEASAAHPNQQLSRHEQAELSRLLGKILSAPHPPAARI